MTKKNLIITGTNGWLGRALVYLINNFYKNDFNLICLSQSDSELKINEKISVPLKNFYDPIKIDGETIIFHLAFLTKDKLNIVSKEKYIEDNNRITETLTEVINNNQVCSLIYISSGAVYNNDNLYSFLKLKDEEFFKELCQKNNINLLIPRLFNIGGPYINKHQAYALSNFILQSLEKNLIIINSKSPTYRSYIHVYDFLNICIKWSLDNNKSALYEFDTRGQEIIEMQELAQLVSQNTNGCIIERDFINKDAKADMFYGNITNQNFLTKKFNINIRSTNEIIIDTIRFIKNEYNL